MGHDITIIPKRQTVDGTEPTDVPVPVPKSRTPAIRAQLNPKSEQEEPKQTSVILQKRPLTAPAAAPAALATSALATIAGAKLVSVHPRHTRQDPVTKEDQSEVSTRSYIRVQLGPVWIQIDLVEV